MNNEVAGPEVVAIAKRDVRTKLGTVARKGEMLHGQFVTREGVAAFHFRSIHTGYQTGVPARLVGLW